MAQQRLGRRLAASEILHKLHMMLKIHSHHADAGMRPLWRSSGSVDGLRPRKSCTNCISAQAVLQHTIFPAGTPSVCEGLFVRWLCQAQHRSSAKTCDSSNWEYQLIITVILQAVRFDRSSWLHFSS